MDRLTPAEISNLWNSYVGNTMGIYASRHFIATTQDEDILEMLKLAEKFAVEESIQSKHLLEKAGQPLPQPFDENDVNIQAKPLFIDNYIVLLKYSLAQAAMTVYALSLNTSTLADIRYFYKECLDNTAVLLNHCVDLMIKKGLNHPEVHIPTPKTIEKVENQKYLAGWFTNRRSINAQEIGLLVYNYHATEIHKEFIKGAAKITKSNELRRHFQQGVEMFQKQLNALQSVLSENGLPNLPTWESEILDIDISPFSDRIMHYKHSALTSQAAARYGAALSCVMRKDIGALYMRLMGETLLYGEDAANLLIKNKFLDQLPMAEGNEK
ncbi:DUF3231 family protein [Niallia oryzisoli]|uniref:DUF3231 family protein n=1 Tax=Niallia oryzisoli TaxID=1737571 RepID=UPI00373556F0